MAYLARRHLPTLITALAGVVSFARVAAAQEAPKDFTKDVRPLLDTYCGKCHAGEKAKGDVDLARFTDVGQIQREPKLWREVLTQLNDRTMPPAKKPQPSEVERAMLIEWVQHTLNHPLPGSFEKDPGRPAMRRLNRAEYNNTVRDLFGVDVTPADTFPADAAGGAGFDNAGDALFVPPILMERYLATADAVLAGVKPAKLLDIAKPGDDDATQREAAEKIVEHFATQAFRRPVKAAELDRLLKLYDAAKSRGDGIIPATKLALKALLVSPHFLFKVEADHSDAKEPWEVDDYELATRLSYFLWSTMPDQRLFDLAREKKLRDSSTLEAEARRMLQDPKSKALAENFGGQWLGVRDVLTTTTPDAAKYPTLTAAARYTLFDEAVLFVDSVFRDDAPLTTLIDADYAFLNPWLAKHYRLKDVKLEKIKDAGDNDGEGERLQRVTLPAGARGGILGLGAVHVITSYPLRTSPVLRGKWVLERVLGSPPPPPPPNVPALPHDDSPKDGLTFRQLLEKHRDNPACASCHNKLDPLGFGMENFDGIGRWRTEVGGKPIDASGVMPGGQTFSSPAELKKVLLARKGEFVRTVTEKLLGYALGRGIEIYDQPAVAEISQALETDGYKSSTLVVGIVKSYPFRYRRKAMAEPAASAISSGDAPRKTE
jgi:hypothetical protein